VINATVEESVRFQAIQCRVCNKHTETLCYNGTSHMPLCTFSRWKVPVSAPEMESNLDVLQIRGYRDKIESTVAYTENGW